MLTRIGFLKLYLHEANEAIAANLRSNLVDITHATKLNAIPNSIATRTVLIVSGKRIKLNCASLFEELCGYFKKFSGD